MKRATSTVLLLALTRIVLLGQYTVIGADKTTQPWLDVFRHTTTVFFYRPGDEAKLLEWEDALMDVWTVTPLELQPISAFPDFAPVKGEATRYSWLMISDIQLIQGPFRDRRPTLELLIPWPESEYRDGDTRFDRSLASVLLDVSIESQNGTDYLYNFGVIRNWMPRQLANSLLLVSQKLKEEGKQFFNGTVRRWDKERYMAVFMDTLYICDNVLEQWAFDKTTKDWYVSDTGESKSLLSTCPERVRAVPPDTLERMLASKTRAGFFYVSVIRCGRYQYFWIQHSRTGEVVYFDSGFHTQTRAVFRKFCTGKDNP